MTMSYRAPWDVAVIALSAVLGGIACGSNPSTSPSQVTTPAPPSPQPQPPQAAAAARLVVSDFTVTVVPKYSAEARFTLTEIGGVSGATIQDVTVFTPHESDSTGPSCWGKPIRVEAGGTLDVFNARWASLSYCAPMIDGTIPDSIGLTVAFIDDAGERGTTTVSTSAIRRP